MQYGNYKWEFLHCKVSLVVDSELATWAQTDPLEISSCIWLLQSTSVCFQTKGLQGIGWGIMY